MLTEQIQATIAATERLNRCTEKLAKAIETLRVLESAIAAAQSVHTIHSHRNGQLELLAAIVKLAISEMNAIGEIPF